MKKTHLGAEP